MYQVFFAGFVHPIRATRWEALEVDSWPYLSFLTVAGQQNSVGTSVLKPLQYGLVAGPTDSSCAASNDHMQPNICCLGQEWNEGLEGVVITFDHVKVVHHDVDFGP